MGIYFVFIAILLLISFLCQFFNYGKLRKKIVLLSAIFGIVLIQGLRNITVGTDLKAYIPMMENAKYYNLFNGEQILNFELGYSLYSQIFSILDISPNWYLTIISINIIIPITIIWYKYSKSSILSIITYLTLGFFTFTFSGLRQSIALSFVFFSYQYIVDKKLKKFIITVFIAWTFHETAIVFVLAYFIYDFRMKFKNSIFILGLFIIVFILRGKIYNLIHLLWNGSQAEGVDTGAYTMLIVMILVVIIAIILKPENDQIINSSINYMIVAIFIQIFASKSNVIMRAGYYYYIFITILIPNIISYQKNKSVRVLGGMVYIGMLLYFYYITIRNGYLDVVPYAFYWG